MLGGSADAEFRHQLNILSLVGSVGALPDGQLLQRFLICRDDFSPGGLRGPGRPPRIDGFPRICRQILGDTHDAQDAYQATFLVLASKAGSVRNADSVAVLAFTGWLARFRSGAKADAIPEESP